MKVKKWYFAAQFGRLLEIRAYVVQSRAADVGVHVTSRWLDQDPTSGYAGGSNEAGAEFARRDLTDIDAADNFLLFSEDPAIPTLRGGRHVEFGYALAKGKRIEVVGPKENIFHLLLPDAAFFPTFAAWLESKKGGR